MTSGDGLTGRSCCTSVYL